MKLHKLLLSLAAFALVAGAQTPRTLCFFFDLNSMSAPDQARAQESAIKFVQEQLSAGDVVSVMTFSSDVRVIQDFTGDRDALVAALRRIVLSPDSAVAADPNRRLQAIQAAATILEPVPGKKAMIYFASGELRTRVDNADQLKVATNAALRANLSIYSVNAGALGTGNLLLR